MVAMCASSGYSRKPLAWAASTGLLLGVVDKVIKELKENS